MKRKIKMATLLKQMLMLMLVVGLVAVFVKAEPEKENLPDLDLVTVGFAQTSFQAEVCNVGTKSVAGFKILFQAKRKSNVLTYLPNLEAGSCTTLYSWGYSYFGLEPRDPVSLFVEVDPYNEITELQEDNNKQWTRPRLWKVPGEKLEEEAWEEASAEEATGGGGVTGGGGAAEEPTIGGGGEVLKPAEECPNGCNFEGKCLPIGTKLNGFYCNWNGEKLKQKPEGVACENNYECSTNSCISNKCVDLKRKLEEQENLLKRILVWLNKFLGGK